MSTDIIVIDEVREFPPIPEEHNTPEIRRRTEQFYRSVAGMLEAWVEANENHHTQRAYRQGVMLFIQFMGIRWPEEDYRLVRDVAVSDVRAWRDQMLQSGTAPSTRNHRISALSRLYEYLQAQAANFRIPILIANPAHKHYIKRKRAAPRRQAQAFTLNLLHQLFAMPEGDAVLAWRDRALLYYMYGAGAREETACRAQVSDVDLMRRKDRNCCCG